jgi:hypothetical protein
MTDAAIAPNPKASLSADEKVHFDARYRWCIRQTLQGLRDLTYLNEPDALDQLYEKARDLIVEKLREQGVDPLLKSEPLRVMSEARKLVVVLHKQFEGMSTETTGVI